MLEYDPAKPVPNRISTPTWQELENLKFVLEYKIDELRGQALPQEKELAEAKQRLRVRPLVVSDPACFRPWQRGTARPHPAATADAHGPWAASAR